jgi:hypothetical protein
MIDDLKIRKRLEDLAPSGFNASHIDTNYLIENYLCCSQFFQNNGDGTITVSKRNIGYLYFYGLIFWDLSGGFSFNVQALVEDKAVINGELVHVNRTSNGTFKINLLGTADVPTVYAEDANGAAGDLILMSFGGDSTDTDVYLDRLQSEQIYYIVRLKSSLAAANITGYTFINADGDVVGLEASGGSWIFNYDELQLNDIYFKTNNFANGTLNFTFTTVAKEGVTDAFNSTDFSIDVSCCGGNGGGSGYVIPPCEPSLAVGDVNGTEDIPINLNWWYDVLTENCEEQILKDTKISVVFHNFPKNLTLNDASYDFELGRWNFQSEYIYYDYETETFVTSLAYIKNGYVSIGAPKDFAGTWEIDGMYFYDECAFLKPSNKSSPILMYFVYFIMLGHS